MNTTLVRWFGICLAFLLLLPLPGWIESPQARLAGTNFVYLPMVMNNPPLDMVYVPEGEFQMGCDPAHLRAYGPCEDFPDELPLHTIYLTGISSINTWSAMPSTQNARLLESVSLRATHPLIIALIITEIQIMPAIRLSMSTGTSPVTTASGRGSDCQLKRSGRKQPVVQPRAPTLGGSSLRAAPWRTTIMSALIGRDIVLAIHPRWTASRWAPALMALLTWRATCRNGWMIGTSPDYYAKSPV